MNLIVDLTNYKALQTPVGMPSFPPSALVRDEGTRELYVAYTTPAYAAAEVAYSRLSRLLGLRCVESGYGRNLPNSDPAPFVSVSSYSPEWSAFNGEHAEQQDGWRGHYVLYHLLHNLAWGVRGAGYVDAEGFLKAHNGYAFFSMALQSMVLGYASEEERMPQSLPLDEVEGAIDGFRDALFVVEKLADLTDEEVQSVASVPEWEHRDLAERFFRARLLHAQDGARKLLKRLV